MNCIIRILLFFLWCFVFTPAWSNVHDWKFTHFTNEHGLPSSYVKDINQDYLGFIWVVTRNTVCRFDGSTFKEIKYFDSSDVFSTIKSKKLFNINDSVLICQTTEDYFYKYNFDLEYFEKHDYLNKIGKPRYVEACSNGLWMIINNELLFCNPITQETLTLEEKLGIPSIPRDLTFRSIKERDALLVIYADPGVLYIVDKKAGTFKKMGIASNFDSMTLYNMFIDSNYNAWISVFASGVIKLNLLTHHYSFFSSERNDNQYIPHNLVHSFGEDHLGRIWLGTDDGLCVWSPEKQRFTYHRLDVTTDDGINAKSVFAIYCDFKGNMWLGTYYGGINLWSSEQPFFVSWKGGAGKKNLGGYAVSCFAEDAQSNIWIGMQDMGLNKLDIRTGEITKFNNSNSYKLASSNIYDLMFEDEKRLWIALYTFGIDILNIETGAIEHINKNNTPELPSNNIYSFLQLGDSIFVSGLMGVAVYNKKSKKFSRFYPDKLNEDQIESMTALNGDLWLSSPNRIYRYNRKRDSLFVSKKFAHLKGICFVKSDTQGKLWIGTVNNEICCYNAIQDTIINYGKDEGFPKELAFSMEEARNGDYWVSGGKGLLRFNPQKGTNELYNTASGLAFEQFNFRASFKDSHGNIYFGSNQGMVSFNESDSIKSVDKLHVVFTGMQLFNKEVVPGADAPINKSLNSSSDIVLDYNENVFTIQYAALNYSNKEKSQYAYYLEGFDKSWNNVGNRKFATYTNLYPGTYYFHLKAAIHQSEMDNAPVKVIKIIVRPPFWMSVWGFVLYAILLFIILSTIFFISSKFQKVKALARIERHEKKTTEELSQAKLEFFTNISHEFRTPLTLILGPLSGLLGDKELSFVVKKKIKTIDRNAKRLLSLTSQLLDFRKLERGKETLQVSKNDIGSLFLQLNEIFLINANEKNICFTQTLEGADGELWFDYKKLETILINLLSNAFKYTDKGGAVSLNGKIDEHQEGDGCSLTISVKDSGQGIDSSKIDLIFDRYYRIDKGENDHSGLGIGLAFVKGLVELHKGSISVSSELGKGTEFIVTLPVSPNNYEKNELSPISKTYVSIQNPLDLDVKSKPLGKGHSNNEISKPSVLVIDDNIELLEFIDELLDSAYNVSTATNGEEGLIKINKQLPDLVICDVMMPNMNGFTLTKILKSGIETSHIPIILLTAKTGDENQYEGLKTGADAYIEKPFYPHILEQNIRNIINTRKSLIARFKADAFVPAIDITHSESDKEFIEKLIVLIKQNLDNPSLDVSFITNYMEISRSLLHLKLKKICDSSATEFVRSIRLREAAKLISDGECNISEAAYRTGFSNPAYFTKRFKEQFGKTPTEYFEH